MAKRNCPADYSPPAAQPEQIPSSPTAAGRRYSTEQGAGGEERELHQPAGAPSGRCHAAVCAEH